MKYYRIYANAGVVYVKEEGYFRYQHGLTERWGNVWRRIKAHSIEHARKVGARLSRYTPFPPERP